MGHVSILLQDGTHSKMISLGTIVAGLLSFDYSIRIFVMDSAVWAFKKDTYKNLKTQSPIEGFGDALHKGIEAGQINVWYDFLYDLKDFGDITITLCSLMTDIADLKKEDFIDLVDRIATIGTYVDDIADAEIRLSI